jgi:hypothetical protein
MVCQPNTESREWPTDLAHLTSRESCFSGAAFVGRTGLEPAYVY